MDCPAGGRGDRFTVIETHSVFQGRLRASRVAVNFMAQILRDDGIEVHVEPERVAPNRAVSREYSDETDLSFWYRYLRWRLEVKHQPDLHFDGRRTWPFKNFIIINKAQFDRANPKPVAIIRLDGPMKHYALVRSKTHAQWTDGMQWDGEYREEQRVYYAPFDCVEWGSIC